MIIREAKIHDINNNAINFYEELGFNKQRIVFEKDV